MMHARPRPPRAASFLAALAAVVLATSTSPAQALPGGINLAGTGYDLGDPEAPIAVVEFSDFGCPYCGAFARETFPVLYREYIATGKVRWKYVPFTLKSFPNGEEAALAAECAAEQGTEAFWKMHDHLYARQQEWKADRSPQARFSAYARALGLEEERFSTCLRTGASATRVGRNNTAASLLNVRSTPTFFVNGYRVRGALPLETFRLVLQEFGAKPGN